MTAPAPGSARPPGNIPKYSAYGLVSLGILAGAIPFDVMQSLVPVMKGATDVLLANLLPVIGAGTLVAGIVALGLFRRCPTWFIHFVFEFGSLVLIAYLAGFGFGVAILLGLVPEQAPELRFVSFVNIVDWLIVAPLAWLLLRTLRQRYWQPWTTPDQWEPPAPVPPTRTLLMTWAQRKR